LGTRPRELFSRGELSACIRAAENSTLLEERIVAVYALERLGRYGDALSAISVIEVTSSDERTLLRSVEAECHLLKGSVATGRRILAELWEPPAAPEARFELAYAKMLLGWIEGDPDKMEAALGGLDVKPYPHLYARWLVGRSWIASLRRDYHEQLRFLEKAVRYLMESPGAQDVTLLATATRSMVHLVREIPAPQAFDVAVRAVELIAWTPDIEQERFLTFRGLAWAYALRGLHQTALHYAYFARDIAPSNMWVTACYADQAYLARMASEDWSADALLRHAVACAHEIEWISPSEERVAILNLVELAADRDPSVARGLLDLYAAIPVSLSPRLALAHDERMRAMEEYARGTVPSVSRDQIHATELLQSSYSIFTSIGYAWRAAAAALRLNVVTGERAWLRLAAEAVEGFPESSVANEIRRKAAFFEDPRVASLTPAQRRVYDLLREGLGDKEIAAALRLSPETVKNHAARVRAAFGVRSRAALVAASQRRQAG